MVQRHKRTLSTSLVIGMIICCLVAMSAQTQSYDMVFIPRIFDAGDSTKVDTVYHDENTETIDFHFLASYKNRRFWDFSEQNLVVQEIINGETMPLDVISYSRIEEPALFRQQEVFEIKTQSKENYHRGKRTYLIIWQDLNGTHQDTLTAEKVWPLPGFSLQPKLSFLDLLTLALLILGILLLILSEVFPIWNIRKFKKDYVVPYSQIKKEGERKLNPITGKPLQPSEMVVKMCDREICNIPYRIWKKRKYQCFHCPEKCDGNAHIWQREFFAQKGDSKKLNWLWFGAAGGALAWLLDFCLGLALGQNQPETIDFIVLGFSMGFGFALLLSWVEELGQGREISGMRILVRILMGATMGALLFFGYSQLKTTNLLDAITWLFFCTLLGLIIAFNSSVSWKRGIFSGLIAGLVSGIVYYFIPVLFPNAEASLISLVTLIVAGGVLGQGIIQVVKQLDKIELQVVSPAYRSGLVFSLDNFLKTGKNIFIGKEMKTCTVRVKWEDDHVLGKHAEMSMANNKVYIKPLGDAELWIDENPLQNGKSQLIKGGEIIRLGRHSNTVFKYLQKS